MLSLLLAEAELLPSPPLLLLDDVLSELDPGRREVLAGRVAGMGQTMITATHRSALPLEPAQLVEVEAWIRSVARSASELARFGPQAGMAELVERWPAAVGDGIARNAWPARIARDGTVHVNTADSVWAFELGQRAAEIAERLGVPRVRFAPGPLPEPDAESAESPVEVRPEDEERAARDRLRDRGRKAARKCAKSGRL